jgi:ABC-type antimicrobial peptide transport system permease subunit
VLAFAVGTVWGAPILYYMAAPGLVINTMIFILIVTAVVNYIPARKIAKMNPKDAIRGKVK